jgi:hypothetical protein
MSTPSKEQVVQIDVELTTEEGTAKAHDAELANVTQIMVDGQLMSKKESHKLIKMYGGDDGELDELEMTMIKYDTDHNGTFDVSEVKAIMFDMDKKTKEANTLRKQLHLVVIAAVLVVSLLLGLMLGANEVTKENHTTGGNLVDKDGGSVKVQQVRSVASLLDIPKLDYSAMKMIKEVTFKIDNSDDVIFMRVDGFTKSSETTVELHGSGHVRNLLIDSTAQSATLKQSNVADRTVDVSAMATARRRLEALTSANGVERQLLFSSEEALADAHGRTGQDEGEQGRKLGFFSALMTSGSFTMMQAGSF